MRKGHEVEMMPLAPSSSAWLARPMAENRRITAASPAHSSVLRLRLALRACMEDQLCIAAAPLTMADTCAQPRHVGRALPFAVMPPSMRLHALLRQKCTNQERWLVCFRWVDLAV